MTSRRRRCLVAGAVLAVFGVSAAPAAAGDQRLSWEDCGDGFECATATVPRDYDNPGGAKFRLSVARRPATDPDRRIGSLFVNFGGPGAPGAQILRQTGPEAYASVNDRFDVVSWDPRGTGDSSAALDCDEPFEDDGSRVIPSELEPELELAAVRATREHVARCMSRAPAGLADVATTNTARDLDELRRLVGDRKLSYVGYSYGTFLGAHYATLFPGRARALVLDGPVNAEGIVSQPIEDFREFAGGFEIALGRFLQACAANQAVCGFGGADPWDAYDELVDRLNEQPVPAVSLGGRPVNGEDVLFGTATALYLKQLWPVLGTALAQAAAGDGSLIQTLADPPVEDDGTIAPFGDWFVAIQALDAPWPRRVGTYIDAGRHAWRLFDHFSFFSGYSDLVFGPWPLRGRSHGAYHGPVENPERAATVLVVGTTYDPATRYKWAKLLTHDLGNARLLTMRGDGHTASYGGNSACIDAAVDGYLEDGAVPAPRTSCRQEVPFAVPPATSSTARRLIAQLRPVHTPGLPR